MPADAQLEITDLVSRFVAKSDLERELAADADLLRGLAWGRGRFGHPEARVVLQLASMSRASAATRGCVRKRAR